MLIDVVIISSATNDDLRKTTIKCLSTLMLSGQEVSFRPIVVESSNQTFDCETIHVSEKLNYNKFLNIGFSKTKSEFVAFCNNDLIFLKGWMDSHVKIFLKIPKIDSLSPFCENFHTRNPNCHKNFQKNSLYFGFRPRYELTGWCFTARRKIIDKIGGFDTSVEFWYSDNAYARQLKQANLIHALDTTASVIHLFGLTTATLSDADKDKYTHMQERRFRKVFL